mmetsp:Transcript_57563/g.151140  ORF Transcript_57563/g.151140 Transcript_57563/m.151140 type:complete len:220 (+) Transcript_57563:481-1140(+)
MAHQVGTRPASTRLGADDADQRHQGARRRPPALPQAAWRLCRLRQARDKGRQVGSERQRARRRAQGRRCAAARGRSDGVQHPCEGAARRDGRRRRRQGDVGGDGAREAREGPCLVGQDSRPLMCPWLCGVVLGFFPRRKSSDPQCALSLRTRISGHGPRSPLGQVGRTCARTSPSARMHAPRRIPRRASNGVVYHVRDAARTHNAPYIDDATKTELLVC